MTGYQYKYAQFRKKQLPESIDELNGYGADGWRVAHVLDTGPNGASLLLERPCEAVRSM